MSFKNEVSNLDDIIDSRQVIERIEELEAARTDALASCAACAEGACHGECVAVTEFNDSDEGQELAALKALADEAAGYCDDWEHGAPLVRYSYFTDYTQELLEDCGDISKDIPHYVVIDWEATARNIQADYTSVDFGGVAYWVR